MLQLEQSIYTSSPYSIQGPGLGTPCVTNQGWKESFRNFASSISVPDEGVNYQFFHSPSKLGYVFCACRKVQPLGDSRRAPFVHMIAAGEGNEPAPEEWLRAFRFQDGSDPEALRTLELTNVPEEDASVQIPEGVSENVPFPALLTAVIQKILSSIPDVIQLNAAGFGEALGVLRRVYTLLPVAMRHKVRAVIQDNTRAEAASSMTLCITLTGKSGFSGVQEAPRELQWLCGLSRAEAAEVLKKMNELLRQIPSVSHLSYEDYLLLFCLIDNTPFSISAGTEEQLNELRSRFSPDKIGRPSQARDFWLKMRSKIRLNVKTVEQFTERWNESLAAKDKDELVQSLGKLAEDSYCHWPKEQADTKYYQLLFGYYQNNPDEINRRFLIQFIYGFNPRANVSQKENLKGFLKFLLENGVKMYEVACLLQKTNQNRKTEIASILDGLLPDYGPKSLEELERWNQKNLFSEQVGLSEQARNRRAKQLFEEMTAQPDQGLEELQKAYETYLKPLAVVPEWNSIERNLTGKIKTISDFQRYQRLRAALGMADAPGTLDELCRSKFQALSEKELKQLYPNGRDCSACLSPELYDEYITIILTDSSQTVKGLREMMKRIPTLKEERYDEAWSSVLLGLLQECLDMKSFRSWGDLYQELGSTGRVDLESGLDSWLGQSADMETLQQAEEYCMQQLLTSWTPESKKRWYSNALHLLVSDETKDVEAVLRIVKADQNEYFFDFNDEDLTVLLKRCDDISLFVRVLCRCKLQTPEIQEKIIKVWKNDFLPKVRDEELNRQSFLSSFFEENGGSVFGRELKKELLNAYLLCRLERISRVQRSTLSELNQGTEACNQLETDTIEIRGKMNLAANNTSETIGKIRKCWDDFDRRKSTAVFGFTTYRGAVESLNQFNDCSDREYQACCEQLERIDDAPELQELLGIADALLPQNNGNYDTETQNCFQKLLQRFLSSQNNTEAIQKLFFEIKKSKNKLLKACSKTVREKLDLYDLYCFNVMILEEGKNSKLCESESVEQWNWYFEETFSDDKYRLLKSLLSAQSTVQRRGLGGDVSRVLDPDLDPAVDSLLPKKRKNVYAWELRSLAKDGKKEVTKEGSEGVKHLAANAVRFALIDSDEEMLRLLLPAFRLSTNQPPLEEHFQAVWELIDDGTLYGEHQDRLYRILQESLGDLPDEKASVWTGKKQGEALERGAEEKENDGTPASPELKETGEDDSVSEKADGPKRAKRKDSSDDDNRRKESVLIHDIRTKPHVYIAGIITGLLLVFLLWSIGALLGTLIHLGDKPNDAQATTAVTQPYEAEEETPEVEEQTPKKKKKDTKAKGEADAAEGETTNTGDEADEADGGTADTTDEADAADGGTHDTTDEADAADGETHDTTDEA